MLLDALRFEDGKFDASITNFGIFFLPDPVLGMREIHRTLKPGGQAVLTCWESLDLVFVVFIAVEQLLGPARQFTRPDFLRRWMQKETMAQSLKEAGFAEVEVECVKVLLWGHDLDDFAGGVAENMQGFIGDDYSESEKDGILGKTLEFYRSVEGRKYVVEENGRVGLRMSAWVARTVK